MHQNENGILFKRKCAKKHLRLFMFSLKRRDICKGFIPILPPRIFLNG